MSAAILRCRKPNLKGNATDVLSRMATELGFRVPRSDAVVFVVREIAETQAD